MSLEEILQCDADTLEAMSDEELLKHFEQYLKVTRPELAPRRSNASSFTSNRTIMPINQQTLKLAETLKGIGVDISHVFTTKKKGKY